MPKKSDKFEVHLNLQCLDNSSQSTCTEGNILQMKALPGDSRS